VRDFAVDTTARSAHRVKKLLLRTLDSRGYRITSKWPVARDVRHLTDDPRCFRYLDGEPVIDVPIRLGTICTGPLASPYSAFVVAARYGIESTRTCETADRVRYVLESFYRRSTPSDWATWRGIPAEDCEGFAGLPPGIGWVPWTEGRPSQRTYERTINAANRNTGLSGTLHDGWVSIGPVSERRLTFETQRIVNIIRSIADLGFTRGDDRDGDVRADVLLDADGSWRWWTADGHHRAAVAAAMDLDTIPVRIRTIADRSEVSVWPKVMDRSMTAAGAIAFFDLFRDDQRWPECYGAWQDWVDRPGLNP
jgi:hypothetical protein